MKTELKALSFSVVSLLILTVVFGGIYSSLQKNYITNVNSTSAYIDWNNRTSVTFTKELSSQWSWTYSNEYNKFTQACDTWAHDGLFFAQDVMVTHYDNKVLTGRDRSYLRNSDGNILYEVESGSAWNALINRIRIMVTYIIYDANTNIVGYIDGNSLPYIGDNFNIKNIEGEVMLTLIRNKVTLSEWQWIFTQHNNNILPLSLAASIASKISFAVDGDNTDLCNKLFQTSYILIWTFMGGSILAIFGLIYYLVIYKCKNSK